MKILIVGSKSRIIHLNHFSHELEKFGIECKVITDTDFLEKSLSLNLKKKIATNKKLKILLNAFEPDIVLLDHVSRLGKIFLDKKIPLFLLLRGNYWEELEWAKKTIYKSSLKFFSVLKNQKLAERIFKESSIDRLFTMEAEPKLILGYLILISDTKSNQFSLLDQLISIFFNPNFTKFSNCSKNEFLIEVFE